MQLVEKCSRISALGSFLNVIKTFDMRLMKYNHSLMWCVYSHDMLYEWYDYKQLLKMKCFMRRLGWISAAVAAPVKPTTNQISPFFTGVFWLVRRLTNQFCVHRFFQLLTSYSKLSGVRNLWFINTTLHYSHWIIVYSIHVSQKAIIHTSLSITQRLLHKHIAQRSSRFTSCIKSINCPQNNCHKLCQSI